MADIEKDIVIKVKAQDDTGAGLKSTQERLDEVREKLLQLEVTGQKNTQQFQRLTTEAQALGAQLSKVNASPAEQALTGIGQAATKASAELNQLQDSAAKIPDVQVDINAVDNATPVIQNIDANVPDVNIDVNAVDNATPVIESIDTNVPNVNIDINAVDNASQPLNQINSELQEVTNSAAKTGSSLEQMGNSAEKSSVKTTSAKARLRELQKQMLDLESAGQKNTDQFRRLAAEAGSLKDAIGDTSAQVKALASDTRTLDTFTGAIQGIAGGFAVAQGAAAFFGDENEDLQKAMLKVQGALALVNGAQAVANALNKDSALMVNLNAVAQRAYAIAVGTSSGALKAFRIALVSTGVGAAVVAIGLLIANFDKLTAAVKGFLGIKVKENLDGQIQSMERLAEIAKARGATEAEVFAMEFDISRKRLQNAKNDEEMAEARHQHNLLRAQYESYQKKQELEKQDAAAKEADKKQQERDKAAEERKRQQQQQREAEAAKQKEIDGIIADSRQVLLESTLSANERELEQIDASYEERLAKVKGNEEATNLLLAQLRAERTAKIQEQQDAADQAQLDEQKAQLDYMLQVEDENYAEKEKNRLDDIDKAQKALEKHRQIEAAKVQTAKSALQGISDLSSLFAGKSERSQRRAFEINKKMSMAQTIIETFSAAQGAYRSQMAIPDPSAPVRATIAAAAAIASGLLRVQQISKQTFQSPSASGGAGGGGNESSAPPTTAGFASAGGAMNPNSQLLNPNQGAGNGQGQQMRAYVVESDVRTVSGRLRRISEFAQLAN